MNYGYKKSKPSYKDHKFGGLTALKGDPLTDGHWLKYVPTNEDQDKGFPTFACTDFAGTNVFEILLNFEIANNLLETDKLQWLKDNGYIDSNGKVNFSDRFTAITSNTDPSSGNDPHKVAETIRKVGLIPESSLPYDSTITSSSTFYSPKPMTQDLLDKADKFLDIFGTGYDDVYPTPELLKEALKYSPLSIAVKAWFPRGDKYYFPDNLPYNHDCVLLDYEDGQFWWIYDSYESNLKKVEWNSIFDEPLRYQIGKPTDFQLSFYERILQKINIVFFLLEKLYNMIQTQPKIMEPIITPDQSNPPMTPPVQSSYDFGDPVSARHSVRVICDEEGLSVDLKNILTACVQVESGFNTQATHKNTNGTTDWGICQFNDGKTKSGIPYWIGQGALFKDTNEVLNNPEKCVRAMAREFKAGQMKLWASYNNGSYKQYL